MSANDRQVGGKHYSFANAKLQHWDIVDMFNLDYFQGQITKYIFRWRDKGGVEDLRKAAHFLEKYIELYETNQIEPKAIKEMPQPFVSPLFSYTGFKDGHEIIECRLCRKEIIGRDIEQMQIRHLASHQPNFVGSEPTSAYVNQG